MSLYLLVQPKEEPCKKPGGQPRAEPLSLINLAVFCAFEQSQALGLHQTVLKTMQNHNKE